MVACHYFPPGPRLPSQPESITALWMVANYTARWQRHISVYNLPRVVTWQCTELELNLVPQSHQFDMLPLHHKPHCSSSNSSSLMTYNRMCAWQTTQSANMYIKQYTHWQKSNPPNFNLTNLNSVCNLVMHILFVDCTIYPQYLQKLH